MTHPGHLFRFNPDTEEVEDLGANFEEGHYTTSIGISPAGRYVYYSPGAHGSCWEVGAPIIQYDTQLRQRKVLAFLEPYYEANYNYRFGGTFGVNVSPDGSTLFIPMNGKELDSPGQEGFGQPSVVVIHIPESERVE